MRSRLVRKETVETASVQQQGGEDSKVAKIKPPKWRLQGGGDKMIDRSRVFAVLLRVGIQCLNARNRASILQ